MFRITRALPLVVSALCACRGERSATVGRPPQTPSTTPAADVSHGEAAIGSAETPGCFRPSAERLET